MNPWIATLLAGVCAGVFVTVIAALLVAGWAMRNNDDASDHSRHH